MHTWDDVVRVRVACVEVGYDPALVDLHEGHVVILSHGPCPPYLGWKAMARAGLAQRCWPCTKAAPSIVERGDPPPCRCPHDIDPDCPENALAREVAS